MDDAHDNPLTILIPVMTAFTAIQFNLGAFLKDLGYAASFTGQAIALTAFMMIAGKLLYGRLADKIDHRYLLLFIALMQIFTLVLLLANPGKLQILAAAVMLGVSAGGLLPLMGVVFAARFGVETFGKVMGLVMLFLLVASFGSLYSGWLYDLFGSYNYAFASFIVFLLPGIFVLRWLPPSIDQGVPDTAR
jgi:MFS family permease